MIPVTDSTHAAELRELEAERAAAEAEELARHDIECRAGWRGEDDQGRPRPCLRCRPHLAAVACRTCSAPAQSCASLTAIRRGPCCPECDHQPHRPEETSHAAPQPPTQAAPYASDAEAAVDEVGEAPRAARSGGVGEASEPVTVPSADLEHLPAVWPARILNSADQAERAFRTLVVAGPDGPVHVRWRVKADSRAWRWRCDTHGTTRDPDCRCTWSAAIALAEQLLGITRLPILDPKDTPDD